MDHTDLAAFDRRAKPATTRKKHPTIRDGYLIETAAGGILVAKVWLRSDAITMAEALVAAGSWGDPWIKDRSSTYRITDTKTGEVTYIGPDAASFRAAA